MNKSFPEFRVIGKVVLTDDQRVRLGDLGIKYIAEDNPIALDTNEVIRRIGSAQGILVNISTRISEEVIRACPNLKFIQTWSTATDYIALEAARKRNISIRNVAGFSSEAIAEKTISLLILSSSRMLDANKHARDGGWDYVRFRGRELRGRSITIVGYGSIGRRVGELARAIGMHVYPVTSRNSKSDLYSALEESEFIALHCPLTATTRHMFNEEAFRHVRHGSVLVNNSRGGVVDESALLDALNQGVLFFVTTDVFEVEPPGSQNPFLNHPRAFVTPHCTWNTEESVRRLSDDAINGVELFIRRSQNET